MPSGRVTVHVVEARGLPKKDFLSKNDPYAVIRLSHVKGPRQTRVLTNAGATPKWHEKMHFDVGDIDFQTLLLSAEVLDKDRFSADDQIGSVDVPLSSILSNSPLDAWHELRSMKGRHAGDLHLQVTFSLTPEKKFSQRPGVHPAGYPQPTIGQYSHQTTPYPGSMPNMQPAQYPQSGHYPPAGGLPHQHAPQYPAQPYSAYFQPQPTQNHAPQPSAPEFPSLSAPDSSPPTGYPRQ